MSSKNECCTVEAYHGSEAWYPNLRHIRLFDAASAFGSLSRAAAEVHISQPAATQAISRLELQFGVQLLVRTSSGIELTERGLIVGNRFRRALAILRAANHDLARQSKIGKALALDLFETHATITHLRALAAFSASSSFAAAGRLLGQAEASVHRAARQFERIGGVILFEDSSRTLKLTQAGQSLAMQASLFLQEIDWAVEDLREFDGSFGGRVRVGTLPLVRTTVVPRLIAMISERYPHAQIEIADGDYETQMASLRCGRIDLLLGALRIGELEQGLTQQELFQDSLSIIARAGHPLLSKHKVSLDDLRGYAWVVSREGTPTRGIFDRLGLGQCRRAAAALPPIIAGSSVVVRGLLMETDRLTVLSPRQVAHEISTGLLCVVPFELDGATRAIGVTVRSNWQPTALQSAVMETIGFITAQEDQRQKGGDRFPPPDLLSICDQQAV